MPISFQLRPLLYRQYLVNFSDRLREEKKTRVYSELLLTVTTVTFFIVFALRPVFLTITSLIAEIKQKEEITQRYDLKIQQISLAQSSYAQVALRLFLADEALPTEIRMASLLGPLEETLGQTEVSLLSLNFDQLTLKENQKLGEISFSLSAKGNFANLKQFLTDIFGWRRIINSESLSLAKPEDDQQSLIFSTKLKSFYQVPKQQ